MKDKYYLYLLFGFYAGIILMYLTQLIVDFSVNNLISFSFINALILLLLFGVSKSL